MKFNAHLVNCTPHDINIKLSDEDGFFTIAPSGFLPRCKTEYNTVAQVVAGGDAFNIRERYFGEVKDLPDPKEGTLYIVSRIVAEAMSGVRNDLLMVDGTIREEVNGRMVVVGCEAFARWPNPNELFLNTAQVRIPIDIAEDEWGYSNADAHAYARESLLDDIRESHPTCDEAHVADQLYSLVHHVQSGGESYPITLIPKTVGVCDDGIACGQNNPTTLNDSGRCSSCQEERDYEDDKYPKEE